MLNFARRLEPAILFSAGVGGNFGKNLKGWNADREEAFDHRLAGMWFVKSDLALLLLNYFWNIGGSGWAPFDEE